MMMMIMSHQGPLPLPGHSVDDALDVPLLPRPRPPSHYPLLRQAQLCNGSQEGRQRLSVDEASLLLQQWRRKEKGGTIKRRRTENLTPPCSRQPGNPAPPLTAQQHVDPPVTLPAVFKCICCQD